MPVPLIQFLDDSGNPLALGKVHTFIGGTTTPQTTFTDSTGNTLNANPVILDAGGFPDSGGIWLTPTLSYKIRVDDVNDVVQYTVDVVRTGLLQDSSGAFTACSVVFAGTGGIFAQDNDGLCFDASNVRLGIGTATPSVDLNVEGTAARFDSTGDADFNFTIDCGTSAEQDCILTFADRGSDTYTIQKSNDGDFDIFQTGATFSSFEIKDNGNITLRTSGVTRNFFVRDDAGNIMLQVADGGTVGDATVTGTLTVDGQTRQTKWLTAAGCNGTTATPFWDLFTSNTPAVACVTGSQTTKGVLDFDDSADEHVQITMLLPTTFGGTIDVQFFWFGVNTSGDVVWFVQTSCVADGETDDPSWNTASSVADTAKGTTLQMNTASITGVTITGCAAGELFHLRWGRDGDGSLDTDDFVGDARGYGVELTFVP